MRQINEPFISVVIPTYHRNDLLAKCLDCLHPDSQTIDAALYEVIVTDDGRDITAEQMISNEYAWVNWVKGPQKGPAANRNNGARHAKGTWIAFTDDDCLPTKYWIRNAFELMKKNDSLDVIEGLTEPDRPQKRFDEECPINTTGDKLWSCNFFIRKQVFDSILGFDENYPQAAMEDVDLHTRLKKSNKILLFDPTIKVIHPWRPAKSLRFWKEFHYSTIYYLNKFPEEWNRLNGATFIRNGISILIKHPFLYGFRFKFKGIFYHFVKNIYFIKIGIELMKHKNHTNFLIYNIPLTKQKDSE